jgi:hypothetical protein
MIGEPSGTNGDAGFIPIGRTTGAGANRGVFAGRHDEETVVRFKMSKSSLRKAGVRSARQRVQSGRTRLTLREAQRRKSA